jgi:hypothetical protein
LRWSVFIAADVLYFLKLRHTTGGIYCCVTNKPCFSLDRFFQHSYGLFHRLGYNKLSWIVRSLNKKNVIYIVRTAWAFTIIEIRITKKLTGGNGLT